MDEDNKRDISDEQVPVSKPGDLHEPSNDVFVDNPESQPGLPADFQKALDEDKAPTLKKSKKKWVLFVLLLLVAAAAAGAYFFLGKKDAQIETPVAKEPTSSVSIENLYYQTNTQFKKYEVKDSLPVDLIKIPEGANVIRTNDDGSEIYYYTTEPMPIAEGQLVDKTSGKISVFKATAEKEEVVLKSKLIIDEFSMSPVLTSDNTKLAYYACTKSKFEVCSIYMANLDGSNEETVLIENAKVGESSNLQAKLWSEDGTSLYLQETSKYYTEGCFSSNIWKYTSADKDTKKIFEQPADTGAGKVIASPDGKYLAVSATQCSEPEEFNYDKTAAATFDVYTIDISNDTSKKVYSEQKATTDGAETYQDLSGWSQNSQSVIVYVPTIKKNATSGGDPFTYVSTRFDAVQIVDSKVSPVPVVFKQLEEDSPLQATIYKNTLFFTMIDSTVDSESDMNDVDPVNETIPETKYVLLSLVLGEGEAEIKTADKTTTNMQILGSKPLTE